MIQRVLIFCFFLIGIGMASPAGGPPTKSKDPDKLLKDADRLAWLKNWTRAEPLFREAEAGFRKRNDQRDALYAHIGRLRGELPHLALLNVSRQLEDDLSLPMVQADARLELRCLTVKGDVDMDVDTDLAADDWERARTVAGQLGDKQWLARANGELGILAFLRGDSSQALRLVYGAMKSAKASGDVAAEIRYLTLLGRGMAEFGNREQGLKMIDQAIALVAAEPDLKDPILEWSNKVDVLEQMGRTRDAEALIRTAIMVAQRDRRSGYEADLSISLARVYMDRRDFNGAVAILTGARHTAKQVDALRLVSEADLALSQCLENLRNLTRAREASVEGVRISRQLGDKSQLPPQLGQLAKLEAAIGHAAAAEHLYQRGEDVIAGLLVSSSSPSARASLIGTLSDVYLGHFNVEAYQRHDVARAFSVIEEVRGRSTADTLRSRTRSAVTPAERQIQGKISRLQFQLMQTSNRQARLALLDQVFAEEQALAPAETRPRPVQAFGTPARLKTLQRVLNDQEAIVEYVLDDPHSSALVITPRRGRVVGLPARANIDALAGRFFEQVARGGDFASSRDLLFTALLAPLQLPSAIQSLVVVPDGRLNSVPFEMLGPGSDPLLKRMAVSYAPSSTVLALLRTRPISTSHELLAISGGSDAKGPPAGGGKNHARRL